jgi:hypothetical protein
MPYVEMTDEIRRAEKFVNSQFFRSLDIERHKGYFNIVDAAMRNPIKELNEVYEHALGILDEHPIDATLHLLIVVEIGGTNTPWFESARDIVHLWAGRIYYNNFNITNADFHEELINYCLESKYFNRAKLAAELGSAFEGININLCKRFFLIAVLHVDETPYLGAYAAYNLGKIFQKENDLSSMIHYHSIAVKHLDSNNDSGTRAAFSLGFFLQAIDPELATENLRVVIENISDFPDMGLAAAVMLFGLMDPRDDEARLEVLMSAYPFVDNDKKNGVQILYNIGHILEKRSAEEAKGFYRQSVTLISYLAEVGAIAAYRLGKMVEKDEPEEAETLYRIAASHSEENKKNAVDAEVSLGLLLRNTKPKEAEYLFLKTINSDSSATGAIATAAYGLGTLQLNKKDYLEAVQSFEFALKHIDSEPYIGALAASILGSLYYLAFDEFKIAVSYFKIAVEYIDASPVAGLVSSFYYGKYAAEETLPKEEFDDAKMALLRCSNHWIDYQYPFEEHQNVLENDPLILFGSIFENSESMMGKPEFEMIPFESACLLVQEFQTHLTITDNFVPPTSERFGLHQYDSLLSLLNNHSNEEKLWNSTFARQGVAIVFCARMNARIRRIPFQLHLGVEIEDFREMDRIQKDYQLAEKWSPKDWQLSEKKLWVLKSLFLSIQAGVSDSKLRPNIRIRLLEFMLDKTIDLLSSCVKRDSNDEIARYGTFWGAMSLSIDIFHFILTEQKSGLENLESLQTVIDSLIDGSFFQDDMPNYHWKGCSLMLMSFILCEWDNLGTVISERYSNYESMLLRAARLSEESIFQVADAYVEEYRASQHKREGNSQHLLAEEFDPHFKLKRSYSAVFRAFIDVQALLYQKTIDDKSAIERFFYACLLQSSICEKIENNKLNDTSKDGIFCNVESSLPDTIQLFESLKNELCRIKYNWIETICGKYYSGSIWLEQNGKLSVNLKKHDYNFKSEINNAELELREAYHGLKAKTEPGLLRNFLRKITEVDHEQATVQKKFQSNEFDIVEQIDRINTASANFIGIEVAMNQKFGFLASHKKYCICPSSYLADIPWTGLASIEQRSITHVGSAVGFLSGLDNRPVCESYPGEVVIVTRDDLWSDHVQYKKSIVPVIETIAKSGKQVYCINYYPSNSSRSQDYTKIYKWDSNESSGPELVSEPPETLYPRTVVFLTHGVQSGPREIDLQYSDAHFTKLSDVSRWMNDSEPHFILRMNLLAGDDIHFDRQLKLKLEGSDIISAACLIGRVDPRFEHENIGWIRAFERFGTKRIFAANWEIPTSLQFATPLLFADLIESSALFETKTFTEVIKEWSCGEALNQPYFVRASSMVFNDC